MISPVYDIKRVPIDKIQANSYNPNHVAPPEMKLLYKSILEDGYTMPIVCYYLDDEDKYEIVDGFHRYTTMLIHLAVSNATIHQRPFQYFLKSMHRTYHYPQGQ